MYKNCYIAVYLDDKQLQRRKTESDKWQTVRYPEATSQEYVKVTPNSKGWYSAFANLDKFDVADHTNYQYRIVEGTVDEEGSFNPAAQAFYGSER